jgi:hypothetical protein
MFNRIISTKTIKSSRNAGFSGMPSASLAASSVMSDKNAHLNDFIWTDSSDFPSGVYRHPLAVSIRTTQHK